MTADTITGLPSRVPRLLLAAVTGILIGVQWGTA